MRASPCTARSKRRVSGHANGLPKWPLPNRRLPTPTGQVPIIADAVGGLPSAQIPSPSKKGAVFSVTLWVYLSDPEWGGWFLTRIGEAVLTNPPYLAYVVFTEGYE